MNLASSQTQSQNKKINCISINIVATIYILYVNNWKWKQYHLKTMKW